jgi:hypothetical protein
LNVFEEISVIYIYNRYNADDGLQLR